MSKRTKQITLWVLAGVTVAGLALPKIIHRDSSSKAKAAGSSGSKHGGGPVVVRAYVVQPTELSDRISVTGTILPNEQVDIQSEVPGKIVEIRFREGAAVNRGDLLVKINDADLQAQLAEAEAHKQLAEAKEARGRQLRQKEAVSQDEYDVDLSELRTAIAQIDLIKAQIAKTAIVAPFSGRIGLRYVSLGSYISPTTKIATLNNTDPVKIEFSVPEKYFGNVRVGTSIDFTVQGAPGSYSARVYAVEPRIDQSTRTLQVRALCPNDRGQLFPGSFASITIPLNSVPDALMVPTEAVVPGSGGQSVFVSRDGKAISKDIELGIRTGRTVQVTKGLSPGDTIVTSGILQVKQGSALKISQFEKL
jgi:membrane fusion protein (multidrug efflux system)